MKSLQLISYTPPSLSRLPAEADDTESFALCLPPLGNLGTILTQLLHPEKSKLAPGPTSFLASAPFCILLGYREMTEAAFLQNDVGQHPEPSSAQPCSEAGPPREGRGEKKKGSPEEGGGTCMRCTCGWLGSRFVRNSLALRGETQSEQSSRIPEHCPTPSPPSPLELPVPMRKSVMPWLRLSCGAFRLLIAGGRSDRHRKITRQHVWR